MQWLKTWRQQSIIWTNFDLSYIACLMVNYGIYHTIVLEIQ